MPLRETRRFKTKGFVVSFGDLMLPLVGLVAIGLLVVAGKIFFFSDLRPAGQPIPISVAPPDTPKPPVNIEPSRADAAESAKPPVVQPKPSQPVQRAAPDSNPVLDMPRANNPQAGTSTNANAVRVVAVPSNSSQSSAPQSGASQRNASAKEVIEEIIIAASRPTTPESQTNSRPQANAGSQTNAQSNPRPALSGPAAVKPAPPVQAAPKPPVQAQTAVARAPLWMVQVGAYSTKASADSVVKALAQSGHTASVVQGRLHRVLVQAGATRQDAVNLAARLGGGGYPGAFVVAPNS